MINTTGAVVVGIALPAFVGVCSWLMIRWAAKKRAKAMDELLDVSLRLKEAAEELYFLLILRWDIVREYEEAQMGTD